MHAKMHVCVCVCVCVCMHTWVCLCACVCVCVQMVGLHRDLKKKKNPEVVHNNKMVELFDYKSLGKKNPSFLSKSVV